MKCISDNFETDDMFLNVSANEQFQKQQSMDQNYINNIVQQFKYQKEKFIQSMIEEQAQDIRKLNLMKNWHQTAYNVT